LAYFLNFVGNGQVSSIPNYIGPILGNLGSNAIIWIDRIDCAQGFPMTMTFDGCRCGRCKLAAIGVAFACVCAIPQQGEFCSDIPQRVPFAALCNSVWDLPHGPHNDQRPMLPSGQIPVLTLGSTVTGPR
jgi:hypothetical protein